MSEQNKQRIEQVNESFAEGDAEKFLSLCTDDVEWSMVGHGTHRGKTDIREWMASMGTEPPVINASTIIAEGDRVVSYGEMTMKDEHGQLMAYSYCDVYRFRGELIAELRAFMMRTNAERPH
ncbi:MAG: nuclear transport factor 2 family protein [Phycisphaerae bacterium]|nr:nuclear transport factor 2 family protein [Gemmatimonadaceae bacterium]